MPFWKILIFVLLGLALLLVLAGQWRVFQKLGQPGWASLVPVYNTIVTLRAIDRPLWWLALFLIPFLDVIIAVIIVTELAERFGKGRVFAFGMILLPFIFYPILGFGGAQYTNDNDTDQRDERGLREEQPAL